MQKIHSAPLRLLIALVAFLPLAAGAQHVPSTASAPTAVPASPHLALKEAAQAALLKSPDVQARWHAFRAAVEEIDVVRGGFLPQVDVSAAVGYDKTVQKDVGTDLSYSGNDAQLTLRQMLFDGFATSSEVKRLGKAKLVRYFELLDASENVALEAARAYLDVVRYREHVFLAEDNYIQHQAAFEQLKKRAESGVGRRVDVDQAASRLALADVNLTTAYANLHDVSARYLRIVGEPPAKVMFAPAQLAKSMPDSVDAALNVALKSNPALRASIENTEAAQFDLEARRAAFMPRVDLVARRNDYSNYQDGGSRDESRIELRLNYNLFNGGSDNARSRQYRERKNIALDQREQACRDVRQTLSIAFNESLRLKDQLSFIGQQVSLVEKTRTAYRDQFNLGQRTLLDLLNTQNEYFDARRAQVNAEVDLSAAYLRSYAGMGRLLESLGLKRPNAESDPGADELAAVDLDQLCPPMAPVDTMLDREALNRKAREMIESSSSSFIGGRPLAAPTPTPVMAPQAVAAVETVPTGASPSASGLNERLTAWSEAWAAQDVTRYLEFYAPDFVPEAGVSREAWQRQREQRIAQPSAIRIELTDPQVSGETDGRATTEFRQSYSADAYHDISDKTLEWRKLDGRWLIVRETSRKVTTGW